jgi:hypothetical protein
VVVPVNQTGNGCDMATIKLVADRFGFALLEDASHRIGIPPCQGLEVKERERMIVTLSSLVA